MMLDQLVSGLPQSARTSSRDRQDARGKDEENPTGIFENLVAKVDRHARRDALRETDDKTPADESGAKEISGPERRIRVAVDFSETSATSLDEGDATARSQAAMPRELISRTARIHLSRDNAREEPDMLAKHGDAGQTVDQIPHAVRGELRSRARPEAKGTHAGHVEEPRDERPSRRAEHAASVVREEPPRDGQSVSPDLASMSPTDEIGLLLGVAATGGPAVAGDRKPLGPDRVATDRKDDGKAVSAVHDRPVSATHAEPPIALVDLPRRSRTHDDDARSSGGDAVRVVGGNGSRRATDIALSRSPEAAKDSDKPASANRVDTAVVLEARRYLGFSPDSNATTLASAARSDPTWNAALDASRLTGLGALADTMREVNTLKLQMNPENLGHMVASLKLRGEELSVEVRVDSIEAYRHLSADHDDLVKALQDQGFSIDKVTVQLNAADRTDTSADRDMARQGQTQREGQEGQSNRNDGRQGGQRQQWESARQMADAARGNGGADADRAGNIYL